MTLRHDPFGSKLNSMFGPNGNYGKRITQLAAAYRSAEAAVVHQFFKKRRTKRDHLRWLKAQGFKEYSAIKPLIDALTALYPNIDRGVDRRDYAELIEKLADEAKHARLIMDLLEEITGRKITPRDLTWLPQDRRLATVRAKYSKSYAGLLHGSRKITSKEINRSDENLERAAITLTEGGGGALYQICSRLQKTGFQGKIARVFHEILLDETEHKNSGARALEKLIHDKKTFRRAAKIVGEVSGQRLRMRNEQFGFPLTRLELAALDERARQTISWG
jgi:rubrerythrin